MNQLACMRSTLTLACLLALSHRAQAQDAPPPTTIPLDVIVEPDGAQTSERLGINIGVNGAAPKEYLFDTGSTGFNIAVGSGAQGQPWFPLLPGVASKPTDAAEYGDGSYGNQASSTTVASLQFYGKGQQVPSANFATPQGMPVTLNTGDYLTEASRDRFNPDHALGGIIGYWSSAWGGMFTEAEVRDLFGETPQEFMDDGAVAAYLDTTWQQQLNQGVGPEDGGGYDMFGIFGAGDFDGESVLGNLTKSGYIVAANAQVGQPQNCTGCDHVILNLTPALRAQFVSLVPWNAGAKGKFPLSGAPISASQFDLAFAYTLDGGKHTVTLQTLLDSGTDRILLNDADLLTAATATGQADADQMVAPGGTLTMTGVAPSAQPTSVQTGNSKEGDLSNVVMVGSNAYTRNGEALYGISFYFNNSVMYDLENQLTGYTPFFVSIDPIATAASGYKITGSMAPQGIAGIISGKGPFSVAAGGKAQLSGTNTYTGATVVEKNGWLGLAGPGSIASSSGVQADGTFDISRTAGTALVQSLAGAGTVALGGNTLELTHADGSFGGQLVDGGLGGGAGGGVIVASGKETLTGKNSFSGRLGIGPQGVMDLRGSVAGSVLDAGLLEGNGRIGRDLTVSGVVAPGSGAWTYQTLAVDGSYRQLAGSTFMAQVDATGSASQITVKDVAALDAGAHLSILAAIPARDALYTRGAKYTILTSGQKLAGTYAVVATPVGAMLALAPSYDAKQAYLDVVQIRPLVAAAKTSNQQATLTGVQSLASSNKVFASVANLPTDAAIHHTADMLSGEVYPGTSAILLDDSHVVRDAVNARLSAARRQDSVAGGEQKTAVDGSTTHAQSNRLTSWGQFIGNWSRRDSDGNAARLTATINGFMVGADLPLGEKGRLGVMGGHTHTSFLSPYSRKNIGNAEFAGLYGGAAFGAWHLQGGAAYTAQTLTVSRSAVLLSGTEGITSRHDASTSQAFGEAGYTFALKAATVEPFAQIAYVQLKNDAFKEAGGTAALAVGARRDAVTYSTLGAHLSKQLRSRNSAYTFYGTLGWRHASGAVNPSSVMRFVGGNDFTVTGVPIARNAWVADAGAAVQVNKALSFNLNYSGQIAKHAVDSGFKMGAVWWF